MIERVERVFREVFDNESLKLTSDLSSDNMQDWDSLAQVKLIIGLEEEFDVKFTTEEVLEAHSVEVIQNLLTGKGVAA